MTSIIEGFRWALLGIGQPPGAVFLLNLTIILAALVSGAFVFSSAERTIVDVL
jgi:ABC-type polysaccharide/polyol phosphate export permease